MLCELTERLPASMPRATRSARPMSRVQIDPERPYAVSLAFRDRVGLVVERHHRDHRPEDLLLPHRVIRAAGQHHRRGVPEPVTPGQSPRKATSTGAVDSST